MKALRDTPRTACADRRPGLLAHPVHLHRGAALGAAALLACAVGAAALGFGVVAVSVLVVLTVVAAAIAVRRGATDLAAGLTLLVVRPYSAGERLLVHLPGTPAPVVGEIVRVGPLRTHLCTESGLLVLANRHLLQVDPELDR